MFHYRVKKYAIGKLCLDVNNNEFRFFVKNIFAITTKTKIKFGKLKKNTYFCILFN